MKWIFRPAQIKSQMSLSDTTPSRNEHQGETLERAQQRKDIPIYSK